MLGRRKRGRSKGILTMFVVAILSLNLVGISYAKWNNGPELAASLHTGNMEPAFGENLKLKGRGGGKLKAKLDKAGNINIEGRVITGYKGDLKYSILNDGSIPFKYMGESIELNDGLELQLKQNNTFWTPRKSYQDRKVSSELEINTEDPGDYNFEIELIFRQEIK